MRRTHGRPVAGAATAAALAALCLAAAPFGAAPQAQPQADPVGGVGVQGGSVYVPGEVVVRFEGDRDRTVELPDGLGVRQAARALSKNPSVDYAAPNHIARAAFVPRDSGHLRRPPSDAEIFPDEAEEEPTFPEIGAAGGWISRQWNFLPWHEGSGLPSSPGGVNAPAAWRNLRRAGRAGARGTFVAVIDTGVAYRNFGRRFRRNPDFHPRQFARGYDFVRDNRLPLDRNGHGTHIAGTIAQRTGNGIGVTGLAYNARILPVRVLDRRGNGASDRIARGIRWAANRGADVINMSFNFACGDAVPNVAAAVRYAARRGAVPVSSIGNAQVERCISAPAVYRHVIGVGGTTEGGCPGRYSMSGQGLDLVAPGGGQPVRGLDCEAAGFRPIYQLTYLRQGDGRRFGFPSRYFGTSMAAAHVSGAAAMVLASRVLGRRPSVVSVRRRLNLTARPPTLAPQDPAYGAGILDVAAATDRGVKVGTQPVG